MKTICFWPIVLFAWLSLVGFTGSPVQASSGWIGYKESGTASFHKSKHQGRKTASGEIYRNDLKTAAHKILPFGTLVKVTNHENNKSVIVKINDRGPFTKGRILDMSRSAFSTIANMSRGVISVDIEVIEFPAKHFSDFHLREYPQARY